MTVIAPKRNTCAFPAPGTVVHPGPGNNERSYVLDGTDEVCVDEVDGEWIVLEGPLWPNRGWDLQWLIELKDWRVEWEVV